MSIPEPKWDDNPPIIHEQPECWAYFNPFGQLVLRQRAEVFEDNPYLVFSPENIPVLIRTLQRMLAEFYSPADLPEPRIEVKAASQPLTNAERQRKYRNARNEGRNGERNARNSKRNEPALPFSSDG